MADLAYRIYSVLSQWGNQVGEPLQQALAAQNIPAVSALLLGLLGGLAPCQVTANAGAIAYVTDAGDRDRPLWAVVRSFLAGKVAVYVLLGFTAAMLGLELPTPVMAALRKLTGPLMILVGLSFAGLLRSRGTTGERITEFIRQRMPRRGSPAFWLGVAFSLGFCPTMAVIFFGALVPIVVRAPAGIVLPVIFAIGTAVPVILWAAALSAGKGVAGRWVRQVRHLDRYIRWAAATVFLVTGLLDTALYWLT